MLVEKLETKIQLKPVAPTPEMFWQKAVFSSVQFVIRTLGRVLMFFLVKIEVEYSEGYDQVTKPFILISNHKSYYDPLVIACSFPVFSGIYPLRFIAKDEFFIEPLSRFVFWSMGAFPTYYGSGMESSLAKPDAVLRDGGGLVFFPEGKCIREEALGDTPKMGAATLALRFPDIQIIPMAMHGTYRIGKLFSKPEVKTHIGKPFRIKDKLPPNPTPQQVTVLFMEEISNIYNRTK